MQMNNNSKPLASLFGGSCKMYYNDKPILFDDIKQKSFEEIREEQFKKDVAESTSKLISEFTVNEQISIAFVPLIFNHIAWIYAMKAVQKSVDYRVEILKKITRKVRALRIDYEREVSKDLDYRHQSHIEEETERFVAEFQRDFTILYFSVNQEFKRKMPDWPYDDLRTYAIMSMLMIRFVDEHNRQMDKLIASRLGKSNPSVRMPIMDALHSCMDAFAGEVGKFDYSDHDVVMAMRVIENDIKKIEFNIL
nr:MAG TPA: hypothetical protein [Bacteriophage sp.]